MIRRSFYGLLVATRFGASFLTVRLGRPMMASAQQTYRPRTPYTLTEAERWIDVKTGTIRGEKLTVVSVSSRGDRSSAPINSTRYGARNITSTEARQRVVLIDDLRLVSTEPLSRETVDSLSRYRVRASCAPGPRYSRGPDETILGFRTESFFAAESSRAGDESYRFSYWLAPDLDCAALKSVAERRSPTGSVKARTEKVVTSVRLGEPDIEAFRIPAGYEEVPPSELQKRGIESTRQRPVEQGEIEALRRFDQRYNQAHAVRQ